LQQHGKYWQRETDGDRDDDDIVSNSWLSARAGKQYDDNNGT